MSLGRLAGVLTVVTLLFALGIAGAQDIAPIDIANEGGAMEQAAGEGSFEQAYFHAARILGAAGTEMEGRSAEELWYIGRAHQYLMAQLFQAAVAAGLEGERAEAATAAANDVLCPYEDIREISHGEQVTLEDYLVPGQYVIFDFFSEYCGPCVQFAPTVERLATQRDDVVLVVVNINRPGMQGIDWQSPVAQQYSLRSIPHFKIYGPDGELAAEGNAAREMIVGWLEELEG